VSLLRSVSSLFWCRSSQSTSYRLGPNIVLYRARSVNGSGIEFCLTAIRMSRIAIGEQTEGRSRMSTAA
jgi:hypothetical protein